MQSRQIDLTINKLTKAQYDGILPNTDEVYVVTDDLGLTSSDITTALGYTPYNSTNPAGYTSNVGTVTSVNNTSPDGSGNVSISVGDTLPSQTGQSGKFLTTDGTDASWGTPPGGTPLGDIYPVGAIYITTAATCPLASLISGSTWVLDASGIVTSLNTEVPVKGTGKALGYTDGTTIGGAYNAQTGGYKINAGCIGLNVGANRVETTALANGKVLGITTDETKSGIVGTLTKTTLTVNIFRRTA